MIKNVSSALAILALFDAAIVLVTMLQIASGAPTPHIPFWDAQVRALITVINH